MSSNFVNKDSAQGAAEEKSQEINEQAKDAEAESEVRVTDRRRFTSAGEPVIDHGTEEAHPEVVSTSESRKEAGDEIAELQAKLKLAEEKQIEAENQVRDFTARFRQAQAQLKAESDELRTRLERVYQQKLETSRSEILGSLLDTLDNLKRAVAAAEKTARRQPDFDALLEGVRATAVMFESKMENLGLKSITSTGEVFDPQVHEAVEIAEVPPEQDNLVIDELQTGYMIGDRLLRPARVRVGRAKESGR
ncbi:MAG: nucleotide exchange factor GrpE [Acidobacteria bacterium]|nr:nucleotide exchange factor GrpE [Acidobacteriota bacterium]